VGTGEPPGQLDGADVLCWVVSGRGGFYHLPGSDPPVTVAAMAVARYADDGPFYLFKCDPEWQVVQDWDCGSVAEARELAAAHSGGEPLAWHPEQERRRGRESIPDDSHRRTIGCS
jgi:hypothetical protein